MSAAVRSMSAAVRPGDRVVRETELFTGADTRRSKTLHGVVVWVHPRGRYHVVEYQTEGGVQRESFPGVAPEQVHWTDLVWRGSSRFDRA